MCENSNRNKRKRHESLESGKTVKAVFKKDDLDDSLSFSTTDWGLIIDEGYVSVLKINYLN